ncbi:MAG: class I SAM-dependent methyltransferase, partial [Clostridiales bacterium]|nr:class I SAM-dependent methyltransferase [Clostridiales bacterium]
RLDYSDEEVEKIATASLEEQKTSVRIASNEKSKVEILEILKDDEVIIEANKYLDYAFYISGYNYLNDLIAFRKGYLQVQDTSSMFVAEAAGVKEGDYVIDVCAAPGGKSLHIASKLNGTGMVEARDLTDYKINLIQENIERIAANNIIAKQQDALLLDESSLNKADVLIADLPCSGLGVMGKKTDIKYKTNPDSLKELVRLQRDILSVVYKYVKVGGTLIYSTCTINKEENEENVIWFTENFPFVLEDLTPYLPSALDGLEKGYTQLLPGIHNTDGFFIGRLKRTE